MSLTRITKDRSPLDAHLRRWVLRMGHRLPRPLAFREYAGDQAEANCLAGVS